MKKRKYLMVLLIGNSVNAMEYPNNGMTQQNPYVYNKQDYPMQVAIQSMVGDENRIDNQQRKTKRSIEQLAGNKRQRIDEPEIQVVTRQESSQEESLFQGDNEDSFYNFLNETSGDNDDDSVLGLLGEDNLAEMFLFKPASPAREYLETSAVDFSGYDVSNFNDVRSDQCSSEDSMFELLTTQVEEEGLIGELTELPDLGALSGGAEETEENEKKTFSQCGYTTKNPTKLKWHENITHSEIKCPYTDCCHTSYSYEESEQHKKRQHPETTDDYLNDNQQVSCPECDKIYKNEGALAHHKHNVHDNKEVSCPECNKTCKNKKALATHKRDVHDNREASCSQCNKICKNKRSLFDHKRSIHDNREVSCSQCNQLCKNKKALAAHKRAVHDNQKVSCPECNKLCKNKYLLAVHKLTVHDTKEIPCSQCNQLCKNKQALARHKLNVHDNQEVSCPQCNQLCKNKIALADHKRRCK